MRNSRKGPIYSEPVPPPPVFRIRHVLLCLLVVGAGCALYPRARSAWRLHDRATAMADYALCMAGPTGPTAFRDRPKEFQRLLRARLLVSEPESSPFSSCAPLSLQASESEGVRAAHLVEAHDFVEYAEPGHEGTRSLQELVFHATELASLRDAAWPFERKGYGRLIRPSLQAKEALHPVDFPRALLGSGLPGSRARHQAAWRNGAKWMVAFSAPGRLEVFGSGDEGLTWQPTSLNQPGIAAFAGRCRSSDPKEQSSFTLSQDASGEVLTSFVGEQPVSKVQLVGVEQVLGLSCDDERAVVALVNKQGQRSILSCAFGGDCHEVPTEPSWLSGAFDVALVRSTVVLASSHQGIVRVRSTRDLGRSWTPATIAFDWANSRTSQVTGVPTHLLVMGERLLLHGADATGGSYPVLVSTDAGASFRGRVANDVAAAVAVRD